MTHTSGRRLTESELNVPTPLLSDVDHVLTMLLVILDFGKVRQLGFNGFHPVACSQRFGMPNGHADLGKGV